PCGERGLLRDGRGAGRRVAVKHERALQHFAVAAEPAQTPPRHAHGLRQAADDERALASKLGDGRGPFVREVKLAVNLVAHEISARAFERASHLFKLRAREHAPRRVRRAYADHGLRARSKLTVKLLG